MRLREIKPGMVIHCKTEEEAKILLAHLKNKGVRWASGISMDKTIWKNYLHNTCYAIDHDETLRYSDKKHFEMVDREVTEFSDLIIPELSPAEVPAILYEICKEYSKNGENCSPDCPFAFHGMKCDQYKAENGQRVMEICEQWKADHEKKEPEVEWFWQGRIYKIHDNDKGNFFQLKDGNGFYDTGCQYREGAEEYMEEVLKEYCKEHEGNYIAVVERVCRMKQ